MRPTPAPLRKIVCATALAVLVCAWPARAEDAPASAAAPAPSDAEARLAGDVGRGLLALDPKVRARAVARLLARIERGGDLATFLDAMARANRAWADRHERHLELWLHQAVHGNAAERERAVRLLTALGERAVRRLALELRHQRRHRPAGPDLAAEQALAEGDEPAADEAQSAPPDDVHPDDRPPGTPRVYDVADLLESGMHAFQLRTLLRKAADAVEVKKIRANMFVVTAEDAGHRALREQLHDLRVTRRLASQEAAQEAAEAERGAGAASRPATPEDALPAPGAPRAEPAPDDEPQADEAKSEAAGARRKPAPAAAPGADALDPAAPAPESTIAGRWRVSPALHHVPAAALTVGSRQASAQKAAAALPPLATLERTVVVTGSVADVRAWQEALRRVPDARAGLPLHGTNCVEGAEACTLFAGRHIEYSQRVVRTEGGAWKIVTGEVPHGIGVRLSIQPEAGALGVRLEVTRSDVGQPIPVVRVFPAPKSAPVELENPQWTTTRAHASFTLPAAGGGAFVSLGGLDGGPRDHVVLVLALEPLPPAALSK